jgi:hypothetical protein
MIMKMFSTISFTLLSFVMMASANVFAQGDSCGGGAGTAEIWVRVKLPDAYNNTDATEIEIPNDAMATLEALVDVAEQEYQKEVQESFAMEIERFGILEGDVRRLRGTENFMQTFAASRRRLACYGGNCKKCIPQAGFTWCHQTCTGGCLRRSRNLEDGSNVTVLEVSETSPVAGCTCMPVRQSKVVQDIAEANIDIAPGFAPEESEPQFLYCV